MPPVFYPCDWPEGRGSCLFFGQVGEGSLLRHLPASEPHGGAEPGAISHHGMKLPLFAAGIEALACGQLLQLGDGFAIEPPADPVGRQEAGIDAGEVCHSSLSFASARS